VPMTLRDVVHRSPHPDPWAEGDNIPWHEPGFSARMLREHLSQAHDAASRRSEKIERQVAWIHEVLLAGAPARVLDLGCGPGLYAGRLAALGHRCRGIDVSPASVRHARASAADADWACDYVEDDLRRADFGRDHDLAMLIYGELNVFPPDDALRILRKARAALRPGARLLLEPHTLARIERLGAEPPTWSSSASGLFSDAPHLVLMEHAWDVERQAATVRYYVLDAATAQVERHAQTMQGYDEDAYRALLSRAGFGDLRFHASLTGRDEDAEPGLFGLTARAVGPGG
jgi:SAM-dependent methyltransferase